MHLGLPNWQMAFTDFGLDPVSKQWFRFLSPERLAIDLKSNTSQSILKRRRKNRLKKEDKDGKKRKQQTTHTLNMKKVNEILQQ